MNRYTISSIAVILLSSCLPIDPTIAATGDRNANIPKPNGTLASIGGPRLEETFDCHQLQPFILDADPHICTTGESLKQMSESARSAILKLLPLLKHPHPAVRASTVAVLSQRGTSLPAVIPGYIDLLRDPDPNVRAATIYALRAMKELAQPAIPQLMVMVKNPTEPNGNIAVWVVSSMGEPSQAIVPQLILLLKHADPKIRDRAVEAFSYMGNLSAQPAISQIIPLLQDSDELVRSSALMALGNMPKSSKRFIPKILPLLKDPASSVVKTTRSTLIKLGYPVPPNQDN
jgi:HEAT repeat protein